MKQRNSSVYGLVQAVGVDCRGFRGGCQSMSTRAAVALACVLAAPVAPAQELVEPQSGARFALQRDAQTLIGVGLRVKKIALIKVKVYAVSLYVDDAALAGPLPSYKERTGTPEFFKALLEGDFGKQLVLRFARDLSREQIQNGMRESLASRADAAHLDQFVSYFPELKQGQEVTLRWAP